MRLTTLASAAVLALSTAVIVQVGSTPEEQKLAANDAAVANEAGPPTADTLSNAAEPEPGAPSTALVNSVEGKPPQ